MASLSQTAVAEGSPLASTYLFNQLPSVVLVTWAAKRVVGELAGFPFSSLVKSRLTEVALLSVGVPGTLAAV